jgi:GntR family transcriptional regulator/MocR family aminotransferase
VPSDSGLHTVGYLSPPLREAVIAKEADARGLTVSPIGRFAITPVDLNGLVLGFGSVPPPAVAAGVKVLAEVLRASARPATRKAGHRVPAL